MSEVTTQTVENTKENQNKYSDDKSNYDFGKIVGYMGNYVHAYTTQNNKHVLNFALGLPYGIDRYMYIPMVAWGNLADQLQQVQPRTMIGLGYHVRNSQGTVTTSNGHQMHVMQANTCTIYSQLHGCYNVGKIFGNFSKFSTYELVGKNNNHPMLQFKLSVRNYKGDFDNYRFIAWGNTATEIHKNVHFKDFVEIFFSLQVDKLPLQNGHSLNAIELEATKYKPLRKNSGTVKNPFKKPAVQQSDNKTDNSNSQNSTTDDTDKKKSISKDSKKKSTDDKKKADKKQKKSSAKDKNKSINKDKKNKASKKPNKSGKDKKPKNKNNHPKIDIEDDDLPF